MAGNSTPLGAIPIPTHSLKQQLRAFTTFYKLHRTAITRSIYGALLIATVHRYRNGIRAQKAAVAQARASRRGLAAGKTEEGEKPKKRRVGIDRDFWLRLSKLLKICIPGWRSKEAGLLASYSLFLVMRTMMSLYIADLDGRVVGHLVKGQGKKFLKSVVWFFCMGVPALLVNAGITLHHSQLAISFRRRLTHYIHHQYLNNMTFYTLSALDDRIKNADQMIVSDVAKFSTSLAELYGSLSKPILDLTLCCWRIRRSVGDEALFGMGLAVTLTNTVLTAIAPPFGQLSAEEAKLEGELRNQHTRLIDWSEEIALYSGHDAEKDTLDRTYFELIKHINRIIRRRLFYGVAQDYVLKYVWGALGQMITAIPIFIQGAQLRPQAKGTGEKTEGLVTMRRLLMNASEAFERLMGSYKDIAQLAGYTSRVNELLEVIADTQRGHFQKALVSSASTEANAAVLAGRGEQEEGDDIKFDGVPIVSPNGDILVKALSFHIQRGDHLLVIGPNGCGKSSLFRILGGLWPVYGGKVRKPPSEDIFYVPQRPYLSKGTLRQQILYPDDLLDMRARKVTDRDLTDILETLGLTHLLATGNSKQSSKLRDGEGLDREAEWTTVLSTGDQQRIAAARLFYHAPSYAILDECTSSLTPEIERTIYTEAQRLNITLMTVSHRRSLWTYHSWILQFDGQGGYLFAQLDAEKRLQMEDEKEELEMKLRTVPELERRIAELEAGAGEGEDAEDAEIEGAGARKAEDAGNAAEIEAAASMGANNNT